MNRVSLRLLAVLVCGGSLAALAAEHAPSEVSPTSPELLRIVKSLLDDGFAEGTKRLPAVQHQLAAARKLSEHDPRLDFAHGLILLKHGRTKSAIEQFESAVNQAPPAYWPAWQALIWTELTEQKFEKGLRYLEAFALLVRNSQTGAEPSDRQRDACRWMGEVLEALDSTVTATPTRAIIQKHSDRVSDTLNDALRGELELGRGIVRERNRTLFDEGTAALGAAEAKRESQRNDQEKKLDARLKQQREKRESDAKGTAERKQALKDTIEEADKQLATLEKDYQRLEKRSESLQQSILIVENQIMVLNVSMTAVPPGRTFVPANRLAAMSMQMQNDLLNYQFQYNATASRMQEVAAQGRDLQKERAAMDQERRETIGELIEKKSDLDTWTARSQEKRKKLEIQADAKVRKIKDAADRKLLLLNSYVSIDFEAERVRLLEAFGEKPKEPAKSESDR